MGVAQIENPGNPPAFGSAGQDLTQQFSRLEVTIPASTAVGTGIIVAFSTAATGGTAILTCQPATAGLTSYGGGVTLDASTTTNQLVRVVVNGPAVLNCGVATFATGAVFSSTATGQPAAASTVIGSNFGIFLASTGATTGIQGMWVQVGKM